MPPLRREADDLIDRVEVASGSRRRSTNWLGRRPAPACSSGTAARPPSRTSAAGSGRRWRPSSRAALPRSIDGARCSGTAGRRSSSRRTPAARRRPGAALARGRAASRLRGRPPPRASERRACRATIHGRLAAAEHRAASDPRPQSSVAIAASSQRRGAAPTESRPRGADAGATSALAHGRDRRRPAGPPRRTPRVVGIDQQRRRRRRSPAARPRDAATTGTPQAIASRHGSPKPS